MSGYENPEDVKAYKKRFFAPVSIEDIKVAYAIVCRGSSFRYHTGFLSMDVEKHKELAEIRDQINEWVSLGTITITQRKLADYSYEYCAKIV